MSTDFDSWFSSLRNAAYTTFRGPVPAPELAVDSSDFTANHPSSVDGHSSDVDVDLLEVEVLDDDDDDDDDGDIGGDGQDTRRVRAAIGRCPSDIRENMALVDEAFRAAGNPKFTDVRLKTTATTVHASAPTLREIALKRRSQKIDWG